MMPAWKLFSDAIVLKVSGKDARRYLNNRLSNDLRSAQPGDFIKAAALTAQGRVEALVSVFPAPSETFYLVCDGGPREEVIAAIRRFIVADRVTVEDVSATAAFLHIASVPDEALSFLEGCEAGLKRAAANQRISVQGADCLLTETTPQRAAEDIKLKLGEPLSSEEYQLRRIRSGAAVFPDEVNGEVILTEAGLYDAVSFSKGCYVGQEVVERSDAIGKLPRALELIRLEGTAAVERGSPVSNASGEGVGKAVSSAIDSAQGATFVFALLRSGKYGSAEQLQCAGLKGAIVARQARQRAGGREERA